MSERKRRSADRENRTTKIVPLRLKPEEKEELDEYAASIGETRSAAVMHAVREQRDRHSVR